MSEKILPFVFAILFVVFWIIWAHTRSRMQRDGTEHTRKGKRALALWEGLALLDVLGFAFSVYSIWN